jgi:HAD superfamily hydrolase (TIGR01549 family)
MDFTLKALYKEGLPVYSYEEDLKEILLMDQTSPSSFETVKNYLKRKQAEEKFVQIAKRALQAPLEEHVIVEPRAHVNNVLTSLKKDHTLCLVTAGDPELQQQKIRKSGIDFSKFSIIEIAQDKNKKKAYQSILQALQFEATNAMVCGDRIENDLIPAHELNMQTVLTQWGRGKLAQLPSPYVDYVIQEIDEIEQVIQNRKNNGTK